MKKKLYGLIFDSDGTILDSKPYKVIDDTKQLVKIVEKLGGFDR